MAAETLRKAVESLLGEQDERGAWSYPAHLGTHYVSLYALFLEWLRCRGFSSRLNLNRLARLLLATQLPDGSWKQARDPSLATGDLNATVINYAALKFFRRSISVGPVQPALEAARRYIRAAGGLDATNQFTKVFLALFGLRGWEDIQSIPYLLFVDALPLNYRQFSQWVIPHLIPIAYLRHNRVARRIRGTFGPELALDELFAGEAWRPAPDSARPSALYDGFMVKKMLGRQRAHGSWGGYTVSTLFNIASLDHFARSHPEDFAAIPGAVQRGLQFVDQLYFDHGAGNYLGCLMDGGIWDTILAGQALAQAGERSEPLMRTAGHLLEVQTKSGGFPYGRDFDYYPDVDDTSRALVFLQAVAPLRGGDGFAEARNRGLRWLLSRQSSDGGWGAFDQDNVGGCVARSLTRGLVDSVDLFDDSSADNTGHVLGALGSHGHTAQNSRPVRRAIEYLRQTQDRATGLWQGRWGINTIYGTTHAGAGLLRAGESAHAPFLRKAAATLMGFQNEDGGFGESTLSYVDPGHCGRGASTPSQTAWVLQFLCEMGLQETGAAASAAEFLVERWSDGAGWEDGSVVGTGHPGLLYMEYPVYPKAFPVMALASYLRRGARVSAGARLMRA
jgi:squalene-hopene/tetraprenyl-beta-curcumene cyclase